MRSWRSCMSATSQGTFVDISETSHSDISYIKKGDGLPSPRLHINQLVEDFTSGKVYADHLLLVRAQADNEVHAVILGDIL